MDSADAIPFEPVPEGLPGLWNRPQNAERRFAVLLAHGAGAPMDHPFLDRMADSLSRAGGSVLRFDYPYMAQRRRGGARRPPDRADVLLAAHRAALELLRAEEGDLPVFLAGKSMGGRMASHVALEDGDLRGLVLLGYPLHPAGKPDRVRSDHFPAWNTPSLFVQGTRDALCERALLERELTALPAEHRVHWIEDGDHSFAVRKKSGRSSDAALDEVAEVAASWLVERSTQGLHDRGSGNDFRAQEGM